MRGLLVEDDALVGDSVRRALASNGFAVDHVTTAEAARSALQAESFDLAVLDIGLPREDGLRAKLGQAARIRAVRGVGYRIDEHEK